MVFIADSHSTHMYMHKTHSCQVALQLSSSWRTYFHPPRHNNNSISHRDALSLYPDTYVCVSIYAYMHMSLHLSINQSIDQSIYLSVYRYACVYTRISKPGLSVIRISSQLVISQAIRPFSWTTPSLSMNSSLTEAPAP